MALETRSRPGLKHSMWKNTPDFSCFFLFGKENSLCLKVFICCNPCIRAASKHFGKTHFQLSFIIAGFSTFCQISNHFPKINPFLFRKALNTGREAVCPCYFKITGLHILTKKYAAPVCYTETALRSSFFHLSAPLLFLFSQAQRRYQRHMYMYHSNSSFLVQTKQHETNTMLRESSAAATTPVTIRTYSSISPPIVFFRHYSCNTCTTAAPATNATAIEAVAGNKNHISHPSFYYRTYHSLLMQHIRCHRTSHKRDHRCSRYRNVKPHFLSLLSQVFSLS